VYRGGILNAAFTSLCGLMLIGVALWLLWASAFTVVGATLTAAVGVMI
jgi:hypothetical protein